VIGIVGDNFHFEEFGPPPEVWTAFQLDPNTTDQGHYFQVAGRLKPGVRLEQAKARLQVSAQEYRTKFPKNGIGPNNGFSVDPFQEAFVKNTRSSLRVLIGAVAFVLLIACANVANLLLVRATGRKREIAIRAAIGAGRGRIIRQLLTESVLLSLAGGALGVVIGVAGIRALLAVNTAGLPRIGKDGALVGVDWRVVGFAVLVSMGTGILFGLIPALQGSRANLNENLKESSGRFGTGFRQNKARSLLVVTEVALALILLVGSALLIRTSMALGAVNQGFDPANVLTMRMSLTGPRFFEVHGRGAVGAGGSGSDPRAAGRGQRQRYLLRAAAGRLWSAVHHRGQAARRSITWRRRLADGFTGILRGLQDSGQARARVQRSRRRPGSSGGGDQRSHGQTILAEGRSAGRPADYRPRSDARISE